MSYVSSYRAASTARRAFVVAAFAVAASIIAPVNAASAQLGGLVRKARDKVVENQVEKQVDRQVDKRTASMTPSAPPEYDAVTLELTAERLEGVVRGLTAGRAALEGRTTLVARRDEVVNKRTDLSDKNQKLLSDYTKNNDEKNRCRYQAMYASREQRHKAEQQRMQEYQAKALSDPVYRDKVMAISQKMAAAQQRGDTTELKRLAGELGLKEDDTKADTLAADKACGPALAKPAVLVQIDQLDVESNKLTEQIRSIEEKAATTEWKESGMNERQFHMARERIEAYLSAMKYNSKPGAFSAIEMEALGARRADLEKVM
jgi:hypothetical protein